MRSRIGRLMSMLLWVLGLLSIAGGFVLWERSDFPELGTLYIASGFVSAVILGAFAVALDALIDIRDHLTGGPEPSSFGTARLPEDHPVREKLEEEQGRH